jgi:hypothetical protein
MLRCFFGKAFFFKERFVIREQDMVVIVVHRLKWKEGNVRLSKEKVNEFDESIVGVRGEVI